MSAPAATTAFTIAIPIYDGVDLMDVAAPTEMFFCMNGNWPGHTVKVVHVAATRARVRTRDGTILMPHQTFAKLRQADVLWTPGGDPAALHRLMYQPAGKTCLDYLRHMSGHVTWVTSVCEGALLLARAGLLHGYKATTHWAFMACLRDPEYGVTVIEKGHPRYVIDRNRITGAGISAGMDEALAMIQLIAGMKTAQAVQQTTQYYPKPPIHGRLPSAPTACVVPGP